MVDIQGQSIQGQSLALTMLYSYSDEEHAVSCLELSLGNEVSFQLTLRSMNERFEAISRG